jgi:hypothetical protein
MERVTGIGGLFFRAHDPKTLGRWYLSGQISQVSKRFASILLPHFLPQLRKHGLHDANRLRTRVVKADPIANFRRNGVALRDPVVGRAKVILSTNQV